MRDTLTVLGAVVVIAVVGTIMYLRFGQMTGGVRTANPTSQAEKAAGAPEKSEGKKQQKRAEHNRAGIVDARAEVDGTPASTVVPGIPSIVVDVPNLAPPFPLSRDIPRGTARAWLRSEFGPPQLRVSATSRGQLTEKYVYIKPDRSAITIAYLENGAVVSAESMPQ
jgi:hypothetical protein